MPSCPKCNEPVGHLNCYARAEVMYFLSLYQGEPSYEREEFYEIEDSGSTEEFRCPSCYSELFDNEKEAVEFLRGG